MANPLVFSRNAQPCLPCNPWPARQVCRGRKTSIRARVESKSEHKYGRLEQRAYISQPLSIKMPPTMDAALEKITVVNPSGEKLVGILHDTGSKDLVILCHGLNSSKDVDMLVNLANSLAKAGLSVFRFDFSGNGESEGEFQFGNYTKETEDLHAAVLYWMQKGHVVRAILGHSKGGSTILLYASKFKEVHTIVNASGRLDLEQGLENLLGADYLEKIEAGHVDVKDKSGNFSFRVTKESLMERFATDLRKAAHSIPKEIRVLTVHGSEDEAVSVDNAYECDKIIANHTLRIVDGADHMYTKHGKEFAEAVRTFIQDGVANAASKE